MQLQQYLPFTVLKLSKWFMSVNAISNVATVLTVYGIETNELIEDIRKSSNVATVLTVYGIETENATIKGSIEVRLQQYLPFTVLKLPCRNQVYLNDGQLQQYLPFTVLKRKIISN